MKLDQQVLLIQERLKNDLILGESHFREFKSALEGSERKRRRKVSLVARDIGETLVAFANADGGTLIIGVEDDGSVSGISYPEDAIQVLCNAPKTHVHEDTPLAGVKINLVSIDCKILIVFDVPKGTRHIHLTSDGRCLQRKDIETVPVAFEQIQFERHEQLSREYDRQWVDGVKIADLRLDLLAHVSKTVAPGLSPEKCLQTLGLAEFVAGSIRLRRAALLLFAKDIRKWHPRSEIRLQQIAGAELLTGSNYNVSQDETHPGNILELLSRGWEHIRQFLVQKRLTGGAFQLQIAYPEDACREALVNALAHRDYSIEGRSIEVLAFNDRLEFHNPGRLLSTIKLSELRSGVGVHDSRNTYVARVLRELGYMQEMGEGIRRISDLMNGHELAPVDIDSVDHSFRIIFSQKNIFTPSEQRWIDAFAGFNLSREEKLVVLLGRGGNLISPRQIWEALDIVDTEEYRQIIAGLQTKGLLSSRKKSAVSAIARRGHITTREVPRFAIRTPDIALRDQREVVTKLIALGPLHQVKNVHYEQILRTLAGQNIHRGTIKIRNLISWLGLVDSGGTPSDLLKDLWASSKEYSNTPTSTRPTLDAGQKQPLTSLAPAKDIYVGNVDPGATEQEIRDIFGKIGPVLSVTIPRDYLTGENRGYAFVRMTNSATALEAFKAIHGQILRNRPLKLGWSYR